MGRSGSDRSWRKRGSDLGGDHGGMGSDLGGEGEIRFRSCVLFGLVCAMFDFNHGGERVRMRGRERAVEKNEKRFFGSTQHKACYIFTIAGRFLKFAVDLRAPSKLWRLAMSTANIEDDRRRTSTVNQALERIRTP
ncbi:hypothetical protein LOK49_LG12G00683 [Camellia lanceoleosa]|uniref:Uncharacterized protein n=1 Tax=Camellia lanceoleosa TaxID=1840588 RepID=A0ACC0FR80_9ERIC|nr:hypothetical protein LOK49_LG12G00683 [Camellia lanceoleosa]